MGRSFTAAKVPAEVRRQCHGFFQRIEISSFSAGRETVRCTARILTKAAHDADQISIPGPVEAGVKEIAFPNKGLAPDSDRSNRSNLYEVARKKVASGPTTLHSVSLLAQPRIFSEARPMSASKLVLTIRNEVRALLWRFGRRAYCIARGDLSNHPETNGEYWLLDQFLGFSDGEVLLFDVGANKGDWTLRALDVAACGRARIIVHAFEPCAKTRSSLIGRLSARDSVKISGNALSSEEAQAYFYSNEDGAGTTSLSEESGSKRELVRVTTLDSFVAERGITHIGMVKIDTEGFDFEVLKGGERTLAAGRIELVQFEYNWRWLINHVALRDVFGFIKNKPYRLGKLVGNGIEVFDDWHFEMDRYFENNYVLLRDGSRLLNTVNFVRFDESNCARRIGSDS